MATNETEHRVTNKDYNPMSPALTWDEILVEKGWLQGALFSSVAYGAVAVISFMCFYLLLQGKNKSGTRKTRIFLLGYVFLLFSFCTLFQACNSRFTELAFIENREYAGGPAAYEADFWRIPVDAVGNVLFVLGVWMTDAILLWRFYVIFRQSQIPVWVYMTIPCCAFAGSFALGTLFTVQLNETNVFDAKGINWTLPFLVLSLSLNLTLTTAIVARLVIFRMRIRKVLGNAHGAQYTSIASIIIESAALHAVVSLFFLVPFARGHYIAEIFIQTLMQDQSLASLLIIFRVARGKAWSADTSTKVMSTNPTLTSIPMSSMKGSRSGASNTLGTIDSYMDQKSSGVMIDREKHVV